jgi:hypothetical protein
MEQKHKGKIYDKETFVNRQRLQKIELLDQDAIDWLAKSNPTILLFPKLVSNPDSEVLEVLRFEILSDILPLSKCGIELPEGYGYM